MEPETARTVSLEGVMEMSPIGIFQYRLMLMCGLTLMSDGLEVPLLSFVSPCAAAEWGLSTTDQATLAGIVFLGIFIGSMFWGWFADHYGRRPAYLYSAMIIVVGGFATAASPSYEFLILFRGITGFGIGGASVPFDLLAEFLPISHRGSFLSFSMIFWTFGSLFVAGVAWVSLATLGWRFLAFTTAIPVCIVTILSYFYLPESPRWLLSKEREREANIVVRQAALVNGVILPEFSIKNEFSKTAKEGSYADLMQTKEARRITLPLWAIWGLFGITYYGLLLFVSRIYSNESSAGSTETKQCEFNYPPIFYSAVSEVGGVMLCVFLVDKLGRVNSQTLFYTVGGIAVMTMGFKFSPGVVLFLSIISRLAAMSSSLSTWVATPELFPTELRAQGHASCLAVSKLCSFFAPYMVMSSTISVAGVGVLLGVLNLLAAVCAHFLPETNEGELMEVQEGVRVPYEGADSEEDEENRDPEARRNSTDYLLVPTMGSSHGKKKVNASKKDQDGKTKQRTNNGTNNGSSSSKNSTGSYHHKQQSSSYSNSIGSNNISSGSTKSVKGVEMTMSPFQKMSPKLPPQKSATLTNKKHGSFQALPTTNTEIRNKLHDIEL